MNPSSIKFKPLLQAFGLFLGANLLAFGMHDYYYQFVLKLFKLVNPHTVQFMGKFPHFFPSMEFLLSFGFFVPLAIWLLRMVNGKWALMHVLSILFIFTLSNFLLVAVSTPFMVTECTECDCGTTVYLSLNKPLYDIYFVVSLAVSLVYLYFVFVRNKKGSIHHPPS